MAMKLLTFHDQFVAVFAADEQDDNFALADIIQGAQVSCPQLEVSERHSADPTATNGKQTRLPAAPP